MIKGFVVMGLVSERADKKLNHRSTNAHLSTLAEASVGVLGLLLVAFLLGSSGLLLCTLGDGIDGAVNGLLDRFLLCEGEFRLVWYAKGFRGQDAKH